MTAFIKADLFLISLMLQKLGSMWKNKFISSIPWQMEKNTKNANKTEFIETL